MAEVDQLDDSEAYFAARRIAWEDGYRAEGRTQGRVETLLRLTVRRFGTSTAEVVAVFLEGVDDAERLTKFGDWVVDCADGTDLIERIEAPPRLSPPSPTSARDGFVPLDGGAVGAHELKLDNAAALLATMEHPTPETIAERAASLHGRVRGDELRSLRELLMGWTQRLVEQRLGLDLGIDDVAEVDRLASQAIWRRTSKHAESPGRTHTAPRAERKAGSKPSSGWPRGDSVRRSRKYWPGSSIASTPPSASRRSLTGSPTAPLAPN